MQELSMNNIWINALDVKTAVGEATAESNSVLFQYARDGNLEKVQEILASGVVLGTDTVGTTALHCAVMGNQLVICELLIRSGISVDATTKVDRTPLHLAAYHGHLEIAKMLLNKNCQVDPYDMLLMTPLHWAVEKRHIKLVRLLLSRGADLNAVSKFNKTPRLIAETQGYAEIVIMLDTFTLNNESLVDGDDENEEEEAQQQIQEDETTVSYVLEMKSEGLPTKYRMGESMRILEVEEEQDEDGVEVIPAGDCNSIDNNSLDEGGDSTSTPTFAAPEDHRSSRVVAQDSDESLSTLHETINKLGSIRGLKQTDKTTLKMLQSIGIQITEDPEPTIISNVLQSGRKIILSEAGKYILDQTRSSGKLNFTANQQQQQNVPTAASTPILGKRMMVKKPVGTSSSLVKPNNQLVSRHQGGAEMRMTRKRTRTENMISDSSEKLSKLDQLEVIEQPMDVGEETVDELLSGDESNAQHVPSSRLDKMEKQILALRHENKLLRIELDISVRLSEENSRRLKRLEEMMERKRD